MPLTRRSFLGLAALPLLAACSTAYAPVTHTAPVQLTRDAILMAINEARADNGKPPLVYNEALEQAARRQANLMAQKGKLSHDLGETLRERVTAAGYLGAVGENVAAGQKTLEQAIEGWLNSPGHRSTLLSTRFVEFGLAVATHPGTRYGTYWAFIAGGPFEAWMQ